MLSKGKAIEIPSMATSWTTVLIIILLWVEHIISSVIIRLFIILMFMLMMLRTGMQTTLGIIIILGWSTDTSTEIEIMQMWSRGQSCWEPPLSLGAIQTHNATIAFSLCKRLCIVIAIVTITVTDATASVVIIMRRFKEAW